MKGIITILFAFLVIGSNAQNKLGPIGQWRAHFDNHSIEHIVKGGDYVYAASPYQIISIDSRKNNYWIDKTNGLSDINLNQLAWDEIQQQLVIVYANSNIDILKGDQIFNVNALQLTNLYPDKKINIFALCTLGFLDVVASFPIFFRFCAFNTLATDNFLHYVLEPTLCVSANVTPRVSYTARSGETLLLYL